MSYQPRFRFEQRDSTGGVIFDGADAIAEIRELRLFDASFPPGVAPVPLRSTAAMPRQAPDVESRQPDHEESSATDPVPIIGTSYPLPLYWHQYANHQHPERNAGSHGRLECVLNSESRISLEIESASRSREVISRYLLDVTYSEDLGSYVFDFRCRLDVPEGKRWLVTHNPSHGELEFCNLWPEGVFVATPSFPPGVAPAAPGSAGMRRGYAEAGARSGIQIAKRYHACYVQKGEAIESIPHHHLETSDKHDIGMGTGDRFMWLLEDENPVVEICSSHPVAAGLCAYMWDAHFAYRVCEDGKDVELPSGSSYEAHYKLYAIGREEGEKIVSEATPRPAPEVDSIPIYVDGLNTFNSVIPAKAGIQDVIPAQAGIQAIVPPDPAPDADRGAGIQEPVSLIDSRLRGNDSSGGHDAWPWDHDPEIPGVIEYALDRTQGHNDNASVRIRAVRPGTGRWKATTLGPAFGEPPFEPGKRYRLSAFVKTRDLDGKVRIGLRLHRSGVGDVFDIASYETYFSDDTVSGTSDWTPIAVTTPVIDPTPDRMHLLLEMNGEGTCWFDDVLFERDV